jgi:hypothetical protein
VSDMPGHGHARLALLSCGALLALGSATWAATSTSPSSTATQNVACVPVEVSAAEPPSISGHSGSARTEQALEVVVEPPNCTPSTQPPAAVGVLGAHGEKLAGRLVALTLQLGPAQQTTCEIVLRYYSHRKHPVRTRTRYCRSEVHRGRWELAGPAQHLPRWAILTGSARVVRLLIKLTTISPATQPIAHATIYLSDGTTSGATGLKLTTNAQGQASTLISYGPIRVLRATYPGEGGYSAAVSQVRAQFQASTTYFASRRLVASGEPVTFTGSLQSRPLPQGRPAAEILVQYRNHGRWVTWGTAHPNGARWHITLALKRAPSVLTTRAVVIPQKGYPYIEGTSRIVHLYIIH